MKLIILVLFLLLPFFTPTSASAHAFGQLYNLPVPFWMYLYGGSAAIVLSFLVIGLFVNKTSSHITYFKVELKTFSFLLSPLFITSAQIITFLLFIFTILTGLIGEDISTTNFNMTFFWIVFVLGMTYLVGIVGDIWSVINPLKFIVSFLNKYFKDAMVTYPQELGYYPALLFYYLFIWIELFGNTSPFTLSLLLLIYGIININGVVIFGKKDWFTYGEFFSVFFHLLGRMGIFENKNKKLYVRPPFVGLLTEKASHFSILLFILFMLSSTAFDGFRSTTTWYQFYFQNIEEKLLLGDNSFDIFSSIGLFLSPFIFLSIYVAMVYLAKIITKSKLSLMQLLLEFAYSLVPIAFVYNIAHYYTLLITEGTNMYRLISDPFGYGWNLFGTRGQFSDYIPDANFIWHSQVGLILLGHIAGVYLAHVIALRLFPNNKKALLSQLPMLVLMVIYTMAGLWILSQPITSEM